MANSAKGADARRQHREEPAIPLGGAPGTEPVLRAFLSRPGQLALIVPCYNEAARLKVRAFRSFAEQYCGVHLLFVDDGSTDGTLEILEEVRAGLEATVSVLPCPKNAGKAEAVRQGMLYALDHIKTRMIGFWDADLATPLDAVIPLAEILEEKRNIEMVFGARIKLLGREVERRAIRHYPGRIFATVVSTVLKMGIYDTQCGAKIFRVEPHTRSIFAEPFISKWIFDVEILARHLNVLKRTPAQVAATIYEYPLERWTDIAGSKLQPRDFFLAFLDVWRIHHKYL